MRKSLHPKQVFADRRTKLSHSLHGAALVIPAHPQFLRNNDVHHPYRQDTNLFYLTGFEEPDSVFVFRPGCKPETILFVMPKDPAREVWDGFRFGPDGAKQEFGIDVVHNIDRLETELPTLLNEVEKIYYSMFINKKMDKVLLKTIENMSQLKSRSNRGNLTIEDPCAILGELRLIKDDFEINLMRKAAQISSEAHIDVMAACRPGVNEMALQGLFIKGIMERGCAREGYGSIIAGGANATVLHYVFNDEPLKGGEMLLIDAGGEYQYLTADITRTYPINGKFNTEQKRVYSKVLNLQKNLIAAVKPNETRDGLQKKTIDGVIDILLDENLLKGKKSEILEKKAYQKYYMHGVSHWLGMDVHDAGVIDVNGEPRPLKPGFCLTIEPGLYIPQDDVDAPAELRGLGIRIEDDILVTDSGHENLTHACPKEISELEGIIGTRG